MSAVTRVAATSISGAGRSVRVAELRRRAERMMLATGLSHMELSILLCDDATIRGLNARYRNIDAPTDVLAFPLLEEAWYLEHPPGTPAKHAEPIEGSHRAPTAEPLLGDVVISVDTAKRQASASGRSLVGEVTFLLAHGFLHLLGFDHQDAAETRRMSARADLLMAAAAPNARSRQRFLSATAGLRKGRVDG